jgi:NodT family efflux transporter outer membrane factor (OMF) lipoprotein
MSRNALAATMLALLLAGCAVGPDFKRPDAPAVSGYTPEPLAPETSAAGDVVGGEAQHFAVGQDIPDEWWTLFHSDALNTLVTEALKSNPDLAAAQAALIQARETAKAQTGVFFPQVDASFQHEREKANGLAFGLPGETGIFSVNTAQLNVSYTVDVFGGERRQLESAEAQAEYQRFQLEAAYLTLTSNVVAAAVTEASLRAQIAATEDIIAAEQKQLDLLNQQFQLGGVAKSAVLAEAATLAQLRATLPPLQKQLAQQRNRIAALAGRFPSQETTQKFDLASLALPLELPVSLPSRLVEQRPDVQAASAQLHEASANIGVATANMLPQFPITGDIGSTAAMVGGLFAGGTGVWAIAAGVTQPIFHGGTLLHQKRAAEAAYDEAAAQYRSTVLTAFQNVADSLRALQADAAALQASADAARAAADSYALACDQFRLGAVSYLSLLDSQRTDQQARIALAQAQGNRYADTAALFQALGGGWWNRKDVAANRNDPKQDKPQ